MFPSFPMLALLLFALINILAAGSPVCTTYYGSTSKSIIGTTTKVYVTTTTVTESIVSTTTTVSSGTLTIPTPKGFTPILSETTSISLQAFAANGAAAVTASQSPTSYPTSVTCTSHSTSTIIITATAGQSVGNTVTSTSTVTVPSATFYAACDANNIIVQGKGVGAGTGLQMVTAGDGPALYNETTIQNSTAYDCCVSCLTTYPCAFSILFNQLQCVLDFRLDGVCDGAHSVGPAEYYYDVNPGGPTIQPGQGLIVSNGACGQIIFGGGFR